MIKRFAKKSLRMMVLVLGLVSLFIGTTLAPALGDTDLFYKPVLDNGPSVNVASAIAIDINSGAVLFAKDPTKKIQPSSLTKLVTASIALEELSLDTPLNVSVSAANQNFPTASNVGLTTTSTINAFDAVNGMLAISAEDCTVALAEKMAGSADAFAEMMNEYAEKNGFVNSHFSNPSGRADAKNYSCVYDLAQTALRLMKNHRQDIPAVLSSRYSLTSCEIAIKNTHRFMNGTEKVAGVYAGKTGGSAYKGDETWAMSTFWASGNLDLVIIIAGSPALADAYEATKSIIEYCNLNYEGVASSNFTSQPEPGIANLFDNCQLFTLNNDNSLSTDALSFLTLPKNVDSSEVAMDILVESPEHFTYGNNKIGSIVYSYRGRYVGSAAIYYFSAKASMDELEFNKLFPNFLIKPEGQAISYTDSNFGKKQSFTNKVRRFFYHLYTPAKANAFLIALASFVFGSLIILLLFPVRRRLGYEGLYKKSLGDSKDQVLPDDELSPVKRLRNTGNTDMQEITPDK